MGFQTENGPMIGLRSNGGITRIGKDVGVFLIKKEAPEVRNSAFQLYVGLLFGGK